MKPPQRKTFEAVYKSELERIVNVATLILGSRAQAEEASQDAFIKLHDKWSEVQNPEGFVRQVAVDRCKDILKKRDRDRQRVRLVNQGATTSSSGQHYMVDMLQALEPKRRFVLVLKYYGGYKISEIAGLMKMPEGTVASNLNRGIEQLQEMVPDESRV